MLYWNKQRNNGKTCQSTILLHHISASLEVRNLSGHSWQYTRDWCIWETKDHDRFRSSRGWNSTLRVGPEFGLVCWSFFSSNLSSWAVSSCNIQVLQQQCTKCTSLMLTSYKREAADYSFWYETVVIKGICREKQDTLDHSPCNNASLFYGLILCYRFWPGLLLHFGKCLSQIPTDSGTSNEYWAECFHKLGLLSVLLPTPGWTISKYVLHCVGFHSR